MKLTAAAALAASALAVTACQAERGQTGGSTPPSGVCQSDAAEALAGMDRLTDEQAMQMTGATLVRQIEPGQPVTMDYRQERVTIETDPATGKIVRASCG